MVIEDEVEKIALLYFRSKDVVKWHWPHGEPASLFMPIDHEARIVMTLVDTLIDNADITECLTSKAKYIRECKKWCMKNNLQERLKSHYDDRAED